MINTRVDVSLPRFNMEESYDFGQHLINMGIVDAFSQQKANLLGISDKSLYVSKVVHKAIVEVNEDGTEAAAGTGVVIIPKMLPLSFKADHPFQFYITHTETNCILFSGKCISP
uniref:Serpin domain-containing protein n=1 Tax=Leptobrachium leishanense TaxID=445787 RepID=A0A8C5MS25_9ANUR